MKKNIQFFFLIQLALIVRGETVLPLDPSELYRSVIYKYREAQYIGYYHNRQHLFTVPTSLSATVDLIITSAQQQRALIDYTVADCLDSKELLYKHLKIRGYPAIVINKNYAEISFLEEGWSDFQYVILIKNNNPVQSIKIYTSEKTYNYLHKLYSALKSPGQYLKIEIQVLIGLKECDAESCVLVPGMTS